MRSRVQVNRQHQQLNHKLAVEGVTKLRSRTVRNCNQKPTRGAFPTWQFDVLGVLTKPCLSEMLLVSLSLWNETTFCIHCSPVLGESGWMYIRFGISGSALPATIHLLTYHSGSHFNLYRHSTCVQTNNISQLPNTPLSVQWEMEKPNNGNNVSQYVRIHLLILFN